MIVKELEAVVKKYGSERKTEILSHEAVEVYVPEENIEDYNLKVFLTAHNYLKKVSLVSLRSSGDHKMKEEDEIIQEIEGSNKDELLLFTNTCNVYKIKMYEIGDHKVSSLGVYLPNLIELEEGEEVLYSVLTSDFAGHMVFGFENGKVARVPLTSYQTKTNRKKLKNAYSGESKLIGSVFVQESTQVFAVREDTKGETRAIVFETDAVPEKVTKNTKGVQVFRMKKGSFITHFVEADCVEAVDVEKFSIFDIPKSGEKLDGIEKMTLKVASKGIY